MVASKATSTAAQREFRAGRGAPHALDATSSLRVELDRILAETRTEFAPPTTPTEVMLELLAITEYMIMERERPAAAA